MKNTVLLFFFFGLWLSACGVSEDGEKEQMSETYASLDGYDRSAIEIPAKYSILKEFVSDHRSTVTYKKVERSMRDGSASYEMGVLNSKGVKYGGFEGSSYSFDSYGTGNIHIRAFQKASDEHFLWGFRWQTMFGVMPIAQVVGRTVVKDANKGRTVKGVFRVSQLNLYQASAGGRHKDTARLVLNLKLSKSPLGGSRRRERTKLTETSYALTNDIRSAASELRGYEISYTVKERGKFKIYFDVSLMLDSKLIRTNGGRPPRGYKFPADVGSKNQDAFRLVVPKVKLEGVRCATPGAENFIPHVCLQ